jgi:hypothetical protein
MAGRGTGRVRAVVNYDDKQQSMQAGWLGKLVSATGAEISPSAPKPRKAKAKMATATTGSPGSEKENGAGKTTGKSRPAPSSDDAGPSQPKGKGGKAKAPPPARGRNTGLTVHQISECPWRRARSRPPCAPPKLAT